MVERLTSSHDCFSRFVSNFNFSTKDYCRIFVDGRKLQLGWEICRCREGRWMKGMMDLDNPNPVPWIPRLGYDKIRIARNTTSLYFHKRLSLLANHDDSLFPTCRSSLYGNRNTTHHSPKSQTSLASLAKLVFLPCTAQKELPRCPIHHKRTQLPKLHESQTLLRSYKEATNSQTTLVFPKKMYIFPMSTIHQLVVFLPA